MMKETRRRCERCDYEGRSGVDVRSKCPIFCYVEDEEGNEKRREEKDLRSEISASGGGTGSIRREFCTPHSAFMA